MKSLFAAAVAGLLLSLAAFAQDKSDEKTSESGLKTTKDKISYGIGFNLGNNFKNQQLAEHLDLKLLVDGIKDALAGEDSKLSDEEFEKAVEALQKELAAASKKAAEDNKKAGEEFLTKNAKREGVTQTETGLQYEVLKKGTGKQPKATDRVTVHYRGTLLDGKEFDSSYKREMPAQFRLDQVIKGWTEGVQLMKEGAKWKFYIPAQLAYGEAGRPGIPPHSMLTFEVELISIDTE